MPNVCVVDTDVVSFMFKDDTRSEKYRRYLADWKPVVSFMTIAELERWALLGNWGAARREGLAVFLERFPIVLVDVPLCYDWAAVSVGARKNGRPIAVADAWIAATATSMGAALVTNNRSDYLGVDGLVLLPEPTDD
ncbi:hypothetical protein BH24CHL1_BH24CHL1_06800 [soil metagenome]